MNSTPRLSMTFLLGPTGQIRTGGAACILEYARRFQALGHEVSLTTWPKFLWPEAEPFPGLDFEVPIHYDATVCRESLPYFSIRPRATFWPNCDFSWPIRTFSRQQFRRPI